MASFFLQIKPATIGLVFRKDLVNQGAYELLLPHTWIRTPTTVEAYVYAHLIYRHNDDSFGHYQSEGTVLWWDPSQMCTHTFVSLANVSLNVLIHVQIQCYDARHTLLHILARVQRVSILFVHIGNGLVDTLPMCRHIANASPNVHIQSRDVRYTFYI